MNNADVDDDNNYDGGNSNCNGNDNYADNVGANFL